MDQRSDGSSEEEEEEVEEEEEEVSAEEEEEEEEEEEFSAEEEEERSVWSDEPSPKRPEKNEILDRISALPEAILLRILSLLPMNEVVKTGSLSRKWQYLWTTVPNLVFTNHKSRDRIPNFVRFVDKTLILHRHSKIYRFTIDFEYNVKYRSHVDLWIRFATSCDVEELSIYVVPKERIRIFILPEYTFSCSSVTRLELKCCNVVPKGVITWKSLKNLWLHTSEVSEDTIHNILLGSPLLEVLELDHCIGFKRLDIGSTSLRKLIVHGYWCPYNSTEKESILEISAPNLHSLEITGELNGSWYRLVNMFSLLDANLSFSRPIFGQEFEAFLNMFKELLQSLNQVKDLTLGDMCIRGISMLELKHWPSLPKCKWLRLNTSVVLVNSPGLGNLLQSLRALETLIIDMPCSSNSGWFGASSSNSDDVGKYWTSREQVIFPCLQRHLKFVKIVCFNGLDLRRVLPFIEFLLKNAYVLEKMIISTQYVGGKPSSFALKELLEVARRLLNCPRSSRNAVVMFPE